MKKKENYKEDYNNKHLSDLDKIKEGYQKLEDITGEVYAEDENKYIQINEDFYNNFLVSTEGMMKQDIFIRLKNKIEHYDGNNNIDKQRELFNEIISKTKEMRDKAKEDHEYSSKLLKDMVNNSKKNIINNTINYEVICMTLDKISKEIVRERKDIYINYEKVLLNFKDIIKDLCLFFKIN